MCVSGASVSHLALVGGVCIIYSHDALYRLSIAIYLVLEGMFSAGGLITSHVHTHTHARTHAHTHTHTRAYSAGNAQKQLQTCTVSRHYHLYTKFADLCGYPRLRGCSYERAQVRSERAICADDLKAKSYALRLFHATDTG